MNAEKLEKTKREIVLQNINEKNMLILMQKFLSYKIFKKIITS